METTLLEGQRGRGAGCLLVTSLIVVVRVLNFGLTHFTEAGLLLLWCHICHYDGTLRHRWPATAQEVGNPLLCQRNEAQRIKAGISRHRAIEIGGRDLTGLPSCHARRTPPKETSS